ncbi:MAG: hypothetical protein GEU81_02510 [Nitriliruptorales bacterium]|nr:hypothetical protein [Nitriliruptorales bacterium]
MSTGTPNSASSIGRGMDSEPQAAGRTVQSQTAALEVLRASLVSLLDGREPGQGRVANPEVLER